MEFVIISGLSGAALQVAELISLFSEEVPSRLLLELMDQNDRLLTAGLDELRGRGIRVMALCPFWTRTAFFARATVNGGESVVKKYVAMYEPEQLVQRAWRDAKRGKDVSQFGFVARFQTGLTKLLPHSLVMDVWMHQQKLK